MTGVQWASFVACLVTIGVSGVFILGTRKTDPYAALSASILLAYLLHAAVFYLFLLLVDQGAQGLRDFLDEVFKAEGFPFTIWSGTLRLHAILSILTKEVVAILVRRNRS